MKRTARSTRFPVALHIMCLLGYKAAHDSGGYMSSSFIAGSAAKNEVVVRQILGMLAKAGLVESAPGSKGGARLGRPSNQMTLLDVYKAVEDQSIFGVHAPNEQCPVARFVKGRVSTLFERVEDELEQKLAGVTLQDLADEFEASPEGKEMAGFLVRP